MSLRVWLPLNGNLDNQGLDQVTVTNNGAIVDNNGKIGKCYYFNGSSYLVVSLSNLANYSTTSCSMAAWVKLPDPTSGNKQILNIGTSSGWQNIRFGLLYRTNAAQLLTNISNGTNYVTYSCNSTVTANTWIHAAVVYENKNLKLYINGQLKNTFVTTYDISFSGITQLGIGAAPNGNEKYTGYINDVRIYDHALSPLEVKRISQGLILHYPLDRNGWGNENLLKNSNFLQGTNGMEGYTAASATCTKQTDCMKVVSTSASGGFYTPNYNSVTTGDMTTFSADVKANSNMTIYIGTDGSGNSSCQAYTVGTSWQRISISKTKTTNNAQLRIYGNGTFYVKNLKYELGSIATPWCPNSADELYNTLRLNDNIQYDISGYGNNGTKIGTFNYNSDTSKYNVSTKIAASASGIKLTNFSIGNIWSMSVWFKYPSQDSSSWKALVILNNNGGDADLQFGNYINCSGNNIQYSANGKYTTGVTFTYGEWHHIVNTYDGTTLKCYLDGVYKTSLNPGQTLSRSNLGIGLKSSAVDFSSVSNSATNAFLSDVRIYATALSAQEVLSLYNNSAYIDNQGNIYGAVYEEV